MTRFLLLGDRAIQHALAARLKDEGNVVRVFPGQNFGGYEIDAEPSIDNYDCVVIGSTRYFNHPVAEAARSSNSCTVFGVDANAAKLETSKAFFSDFARQNGITVADSRAFDTMDEALTFLRSSEPPYVIKADGPARGCGVEIVRTLEEAERDLRRKLEDKTSPFYAGKVNIERFIEGFEVAINVFMDGESYVIFPPTKPHKRRHNGDSGPNVAGMGSLSPVELNEQFYKEFRTRVIEPTLKSVRENGWHFRGCLFMNLMLNESGIYVLEYNCRMGDPAMLVDIELTESSLSELVLNTARGTLSKCAPTFKKGYAAATTIVRANYPEPANDAGPVTLPPTEVGTKIFVASVTQKENTLVAGGGVVASAVAFDSSRDTALSNSRELALRFIKENVAIRLDCRTDIGSSFVPPRHFAVQSSDTVATIAQ